MARAIAEPFCSNICVDTQDNGSDRATIQGSLTEAWSKTLLKVHCRCYNGPSNYRGEIGKNTGATWRPDNQQLPRMLEQLKKKFKCLFLPVPEQRLKCYINRWKKKCSGIAPPSADIQVGGCQVPGLKVAPIPVGSEDLLREKKGRSIHAIRWRQ